jgi:hypothetical protein
VSDNSGYYEDSSLDSYFSSILKLSFEIYKKLSILVEKLDDCFLEFR